MNFIEKIAYNFLYKNPKLKLKVRNLYQDFFELFSRDKQFINGQLLSYDNYFFGFHDISPFSPDDKRILVHRISFSELRMPNRADFVEVGFLYGENYSKFQKLGTTKAWNWHKGSRLQWIDNDTLIHNDIRGDKIASRRINYTNFSRTYNDFPIDTVSADGTMASSFNYDRLELLMPGYGYRQHINEEIKCELKPNDDGLFVINLKTQLKTLLISIKELSELSVDFDKPNYLHFVTHTKFNKSSDKILFLHRIVDPTNLYKRHTKLVSYDLKSNSIHVAPTDGMVSHYHINNRDQIVAYCSINKKSAHYLFENCEMNKYEFISADTNINSDGHQHFFPNDPNLFVTDTYPDRCRYSSLNIVNIKSKETEKILNIKSPSLYRPPDIFSHWSCDLHPRVSHNGKIICFDSTHSMKRSINFLTL